VKGARN